LFVKFEHLLGRLRVPQTFRGLSTVGDSLFS